MSTWESGTRIVGLDLLVGRIDVGGFVRVRSRVADLLLLLLLSVI